MHKKLLLMAALCATTLCSALSIPITGTVGSASGLHDGTALGDHDPSSRQSSWTDLASFQVDSGYVNGFTITAQLQHAGWSYFGVGNTQGTDYNVFTGFRFRSDDSANYVGASGKNSIMPTWETIDTSPVSFSNGVQTQAMTNWEVKAQAKWEAANDLQAGGYLEVLTVTIAEGA